MRRMELLALAVVLLVIAGIPAAVLSYQALAREVGRDDVLVVIRTVERGGFTPSRIAPSSAVRSSAALTLPDSPSRRSALSAGGRSRLPT